MKRWFSFLLCMTCLLCLLTSCVYIGSGAATAPSSNTPTETEPTPTQAPVTTEEEPLPEPTTPVTPAESGSAEIPNQPDDGHTKLY